MIIFLFILLSSLTFGQVVDSSGTFHIIGVPQTLWISPLGDEPDSVYVEPKIAMINDSLTFIDPLEFWLREEYPVTIERYDSLGYVGIDTLVMPYWKRVEFQTDLKEKQLTFWELK